MAITHDTASITISGTETGATLRTYITTNSLGTVSGLATIVNRNLIFSANCVFTDAQATWTMTGVFYISEALGSTLNFTDVTIIIGGGLKTAQHSLISGSIRNWTRVKYLILNQGGSRYDFSGPVGANRENFDTVELFTNANTSFLHIASNANKTLTDTTVTLGPSVGSTGIVTQADANITITFLRARLNVVSVSPRIYIDGLGAILFDAYSSNATTWTIERRGFTGAGGICTFRDPVKPAGFVGYDFVSANSEFREEMRHNAQVINAAGSGVQSVRVRLRNDTSNAWVYATQTTNATGAITEQFVRTRTRAQNSNTDVVSTAFRVVCTAYGFLKSGGARSFTAGPITEKILLVADPSVTLSEAAAGALTSIATLDDLYDAVAHWSTRDTDNVLYPSEAAFLVTPSGSVLDFGARNIVVDATAAAAFAVNTTTNTITIKASALTKGTKFLSLKTTGAVTVGSGVTLSNLIFDSSVNQATPTNLTGVNITGTLTYNTNSATSITYTTCTIGTVENSGTGLVTITPTGSTVTTYTDAEINFLDSRLTATGITSATIYPSEADRDANINGGPIFTTVLNFKLGSTVSGVVMTGTIYLRVNFSGTILFSSIALALGTNELDLGVQGQLSAISANLATKPTLAQIEASTVLAKEATVAAKASQTSVNAIPTNPLLTTDARLNNLDATVSSRLASSTYTTPPTSAQNATATRTELTTELGRIDVAISTRLATSGYTTPPTAATIQSGLATSANVTSAQTAIVAEINANEAKIDTLQTAATAIKAKTDTLVNGPTLGQIEGSTVLAKESTLSTKASQASVTVLGTPMQAGEVVDANIIKVNDVLIDGAGTQADPFGPV